MSHKKEKESSTDLQILKERFPFVHMQATKNTTRGVHAVHWLNSGPCQKQNFSKNEYKYTYTQQPTYIFSFSSGYICKLASKLYKMNVVYICCKIVHPSGNSSWSKAIYIYIFFFFFSPQGSVILLPLKLHIWEVVTLFKAINFPEM